MDPNLFLGEILVGIGSLIVIIIAFLAKMATRVAVLEAMAASNAARLSDIESRLDEISQDLHFVKGLMEQKK